MREVILIRHGESVGNVARDQALADDEARIDIQHRDADVVLTELGRRQAAELGPALSARLGTAGTVEVFCSPYQRAVQTVTLALEEAGLAHAPRIDERLRDRELGILDRLTAKGITEQFPEEADRRRFLGKLYYRPPGGESWADVALRIRSFVHDHADAAAATVLISTHDAVIMLFRYVLEELSEADLMELARASVRNASVTRLVAGADRRWRATEYDDGSHLSEPTTAPAASDHDD